MKYVKVNRPFSKLITEIGGLIKMTSIHSFFNKLVPIFWLTGFWKPDGEKRDFSVENRRCPIETGGLVSMLLNHVVHTQVAIQHLSVAFWGVDKHSVKGSKNYREIIIIYGILLYHKMILLNFVLAFSYNYTNLFQVD